MKIGDLVVLKGHCKNHGRPALVIEVGFAGCVRIAYADTGSVAYALVSNLDLINESR